MMRCRARRSWMMISVSKWKSFVLRWNGICAALDRVDAIAGMELAEAGSEQTVLERGQDLVADELVERHPAPQRAARFEHSRAEHHVGRAGDERSDELGQRLGRVLPSPCSSAT